MSRIWKRNNKWTALGDCVYYHQVRGLQLFMKQPKEKGQTTHLSLEEQSRADRRQVCSCRLLLPLPPLPFLHWTYLGSGNEKKMREYRKKTSVSAQKRRYLWVDFTVLPETGTFITGSRIFQDSANRGLVFQEWAASLGHQLGFYSEAEEGLVLQSEYTGAGLRKITKLYWTLAYTTKLSQHSW